MAGEIAEGFVRIRSDTSGFKQETSRGVLSTVGGVAKAATGLFAGFAIFKAVKDDVIGFNSTLEQSKAAFTNLLGSGKAANVMLEDLQNFAKTTPFAFEQLIPVAQQLVGALGKGVDVTAVMTNLGDAISATGGSADKLSQLTLAYTQLATSGTAHLGDLMQINNAVPGALARMAAAAGQSVGQFRDSVSKGMVSSGDAVKLFHTITTDPKFGIAGGMDAQSKTFAGAMSNIGDAIQQGLAQAGKPIFEFVSGAAKGFAGFLTVLQDTGSVFGSEMDQFFGQFGTKGVIMLAVLRGIVTGFILLKDGVSLAFQGIGIAADLIAAHGDQIKAIFDTIVSAIQAAIPPATEFFNFIVAHANIFGPLAIGIGITIAALFALSAAMVVGTAVATAFGAALALAFSPIVIIVVSIGLLVGALILLYRNNATARAIIQGAWQAIQSTIMTTLSVIRTAIVVFVAVARAAWAAFGPAITQIVRNAFNTIKGVIQGTLQVVRGIINVVLGLIHGDWSRVWTGIQQILRGALGIMLALLRGAVGNFIAAARALGTGLLNGIVSIVKQIPGKVAGLIHQIPGAIGDVSHLLYTVGIQMIQGLVGGIKSMAGAAADAAKSVVGGAVDGAKSLLGIDSPSKLMHEEIGRPMVQGIVTGITEEIPSVEAALASIANQAKTAAASLGPIGSVLPPATTPARGSGLGTSPGLLEALGASGGTTVHVDQLTIVSNDPDGIMRAILNEAARVVPA